MFNRMINELILPSAEILSQDYFIGFSHLIMDSIAEIYHILKIRGSENLTLILRVRKGIQRNDKIHKLIISIIQDELPIC